MNYRIVIPTYKRANVLWDTTLALLKKHNIPNDKIDILISTKKEADYYKTIIGHKYNFIYHGQTGITSIRNFIKHYYKYKTDLEYLICIDDDIKEINKMNKPIEDLNGFIEFMFNKTKELGYNLWGICCYDNTFFMKNTITTNLKFICGGFCGEIIDRNKHDIYIDLDLFEDYAMTCEHFIRDGGIVRNNEYCLITKNFAKGGVVESYGSLQNRLNDMEKDSFNFIERYGNMARIVKKKNRYDIRLNHNYKNESI
jgi:hypothetical protein|tara:strand:- start:1198 stop:1962 length:765 start_codon:yes stop_codon:yes gene_type:complete